MMRISHGKNTHSRTDIQDQLLFTEQSLVHLRDSLLFLLSIWEVNGLSGSLQDKLLQFQFQRNILIMLKEYNFIYINRASKLNLTDPTINQLRRSEILKLINGTMCWLLVKKNKSSELAISEVETTNCQVARELMKLPISLDL